MNLEENISPLRITSEKATNCIYCECYFPKEWDHLSVHICGDPDNDLEGQQDCFMKGFDSFMRLKEKGKFVYFKKNHELVWEKVE